MLKNISNLGTILNKTEKKNINGSDKGCNPFEVCDFDERYDYSLCQCVPDVPNP
ncbi:hypothetical protein [Tenacibaculum litoreum]|uniref:hypothetical protein n=1 Tax=Tenacibaculum litoreum TaxID=321269 RepID=UPI0038B5D1BE